MSPALRRMMVVFVGLLPRGSMGLKQLSGVSMRSMRRNMVTTMMLPNGAAQAELKFSAVGAEEMFSTRSDVERTVVVCGRRETLESDSFITDVIDPFVGAAMWKRLLASAPKGDKGGSASIFNGEASTLVACVLPDACSRHNSRVRPHAVTALAGGEAAKAKGRVDVILAIDDIEDASAAACALARALPLYDAKSQTKEAAKTVTVAFAGDKLVVDDGVYSACDSAARAVRLASQIVDMPPNVLTTTRLVAEAQAVADRLNALGVSVDIEIVTGEALRDAGYGGIYNVGKAAEEPPSLVVLTRKANAREGAPKSVCLVGKGIVFDTGGLSLKVGGGMCGMKTDCGGAAAVLGAFEAACELTVEEAEFEELHCVLCVAENAIGSKAMRNDDIICFLSGKTCEINNTDAEGRLVLADGVAHAALKLKADLIIDMATLTGAQMVATGRRHAAIFSNSEELERRCVDAGRLSGDLVHALPFCPEFYRSEFESKVADMKNSVKDRMNAQSSCAANFILEAGLPDYKGEWLHVDLAGPSVADERGTGFGVGLALALLKVKGFTGKGA